MKLIKRMNVFIMVFLVIGMTMFEISFAGADELENAPAIDISVTGNTTLMESATEEDAQETYAPVVDGTVDDSVLADDAQLNVSSSKRNQSTQSYEQPARAVIPAVTAFSDSTSSQKFVYVSNTSTLTAGYATTQPADPLSLAGYNKGAWGSSVAASWSAPPPWNWYYSTDAPFGSGAYWISTAASTEAGSGDQWRLYSINFTIPEGATLTSAHVWYTADNAVAVYLNNEQIGIAGTVYGASNDTTPVYQHAYNATFIPQTGSNTLKFVVRNWASPYSSNPTGLLYKVALEYEPQTEYKVYAEAGETDEIYTIAKGFWDQMIIAENGGIEWNNWQSASDIIPAADARESHWNWTTNAADWVENADFAYFSGHGNQNRIAFHNYDEGSGLNYIPSESMRLGSGRLKWAVLDSCESLNHTSWINWQQSFTGLHMLIGMNTSTVPSFDGSSRGRGEVFARLMKNDYYPYTSTPLKIIDAWDWAGKYTWPYEPGHSSYDVFTGVVYDTNCLNDYLPGWGSSCTATSGSQGYQTTLVFAQYQSSGKSNAGYHSLELNNGKYTLSGSVPTKETITVYSYKKPEYTKNWANSLAKNLGMSGKTSETANAFYAGGSDVKNYYFVLQKDAPVISFQKFDARSGFPQSHDESVSAANAFLTENGLMSSEALEPGVAYNSGESISKSGERKVDWRTSVVTYTRELDGLPVWNSQKMVELDSKGNVIGYFQNWRDYKPYKEFKLKSLDTAFTEFQAKQDFPDKADKIVVTSVQIGYYSQPAVAKEKLLQPIYVFEGYDQYGNSTEPFTPVAISATDEVFDEIP